MSAPALPASVRAVSAAAMAVSSISVVDGTQGLTLDHVAIFIQRRRDMSRLSPRNPVPFTRDS